MEILNKLQKKALRLAFDSKMWCHTEKLLKLAEISPVNNLYKSVALQFAIKCGAIYEYGLLADFD